LERYALDMKSYPTTEAGLDALLEPPEESDLSTNWDGPYVNKDVIPKDPWGNKYQYEYPPTRSKGGNPDIWSYGADGEDDTEDDIVSWSSGDAGEEGLEESQRESDIEG
jgi:general secretion pathway protein G